MELDINELVKIGQLEQYSGKKVAVGLSGGVDSAISAYLLKRAGAEVKGVFMKNWAGEAGLDGSCPWEEDLRSAAEVADFLRIEVESVNFEKEYKKYVLDNFFAEYEAGRTPNPDILCNSEIKFKAFLDYVVAEGFDYVATGHYAKVERLSLQPSAIAKEIEGYFLTRPKDRVKDQTYFLSALDQSQLSRSVFPLANYEKSQVRALASFVGLPNAARPDSQGICFVGDIDVRQFLANHLKPEQGQIIDIDSGKVVGSHNGMSLYTIGQREGLGLGGFAVPYYVVAKSANENAVYVGTGRNHPLLNKTQVRFSDLTWQHPDLAKLNTQELNSLGLSAAVRYRQKPAPGSLAEPLAEQREQGLGQFEFISAQWAIAPGQSIVFSTSDGVTIGRAIIS